ncbi:MAG TPA: tRNA pseudouridine(13) synthase TruD [Sedimenticola sp.]|nr:tRNA pseudouridine(13) synthase TruD [Sedimenticola sp.]
MDLPYAFGGPCCRGVIRSVPEDFQVEEIPAFMPDGSGEHVLLEIEKRDANSDWVAGLLARLAGVPRREVSYAGMKDRHAVTRQWFSVRLAGRAEPDWQALDDADSLRVLQATRHRRKLRRGALRGNRFRLRVRGLTGDTGRLEETLVRLRARGMPNGFGEQRFGRDGGNLSQALRLFAGEAGRLKRPQRGILLSAARSLLFNRVLARRVAEGSWERLLPGERVIFEGSRSGFLYLGDDAAAERRLQALDLHPSGPLWGRGEPGTAGAVARLEREVLAPLAVWREGLERLGLKMERRALRAPVSGLQWSLADGCLELEFALPKGAYATALLRELIDYRAPSYDSDQAHLPP